MPQATFKYEYMSNSLSVRLEPSSSSSTELTASSSPRALDPRTGKFTSEDVYGVEDKEKSLDSTLQVLQREPSSFDMQPKRKLLDEIESLKKLKINELEELARIQQYKTICIQELSHTKEQVSKEKEYLKKLKEDSDRFKQHFATQQGDFKRLNDPSHEKLFGEEQSRPQSHPPLQGLRDRYKYQARMVQQEQPNQNFTIPARAKLEEKANLGKDGDSYSDTVKHSVRDDTTKSSPTLDERTQRDVGKERLTGNSINVLQKQHDIIDTIEEKKHVEKVKLPYIEPKKPHTLLKPEWYKAQLDDEAGHQLQHQKSYNNIDKVSGEHKEKELKIKSDKMLKQGTSSTTNSQIGQNRNVDEKEINQQNTRQSSDMSLKDLRHHSRHDEEIQLIHEKYNDRITITRESDKKQTESNRIINDPNEAKNFDRKEECFKVIQPSQPKNRDDVSKSMDLTHPEERNKRVLENKPKEPKEANYRHILPAPAPSQQLEKARSGTQIPFAGGQGSNISYPLAKSSKLSYEQQPNMHQKSEDEKQREEFKQNFELRQKQLEQEQQFQQKPHQPTFSPSGGARITADVNRSSTWSTQQGSCNNPTEQIEKQPKSYLSDHQQQQALQSRKTISDQSLTPQRVPNPAAISEFVSPQSMATSVSQSQHHATMQSQLRPQQPHALQAQFRGPQSHPSTSPQIGQHHQMQGMPPNRPPMSHLYPNQHSNTKAYPNQHEQFYAAAMSAATAAAAAASNGMDPKSAAANAARQLAPPQSSFNSVAFQNMAAAAAAAALATCGGRTPQAPPYPSQVPRPSLPSNDRSSQFGTSGMDIRRNEPSGSSGREIVSTDERNKAYPVDLGHMTANRNNAMWFAMQQHQKEQLQKLQQAQQPQQMKTNPQLMAHQQNLTGVPPTNDRQSSSHLNVHEKNTPGMHSASNLAYAAQQQHLLAQQRQQQQQQQLQQQQQQQQSQFERQMPQSRHLPTQHEGTHPLDRAATLSRQERNLPYGRPLPPPNYPGHSTFSQDAERTWRSQQARNTPQAQEISSSGSVGATLPHSNNGIRVSPKATGGHRMPPRSGSRGSDLGFSEVVASARNSITRMENSAVVEDRGSSESSRRPFGPDVVCKICKKEASFMCSACRGAHYCSLECQVNNIDIHSSNIFHVFYITNVLYVSDVRNNEIKGTLIARCITTNVHFEIAL